MRLAFLCSNRIPRAFTTRRIKSTTRYLMSAHDPNLT